MLRLGLIENLQRVATRLTIAREDRDLADLWVDRLQEMAEKNPSHLVVVVADMAKVRSSHLQFVRGGILSAFVATKSGVASRARLARTAARGTRVVHRTAGPSGESKSGGRPGFRQPQYCQSSFLERHGLEGVRGDPESGRGDVALRPGRRLQRDGFFDPRSLSPFGRVPCPAQPTLGSGRRAARHPTGRRQCPAKGARRPDRPCGLLSDRQRPVRAGAHGECAVALANDHRTKHPPFSADVLCGRYWGAHFTRHVRVYAAGPDARSAGMETHFLHPCFPPLCQPTGRGVDELAVHAAGETPPAPAPGLFLRHRCRLPHDGGRSHDAHEPGRR